ncbi:MAG: hypothetical protein ABGX16_24160 [Pirellulales bacterium]
MHRALIIKELRESAGIAALAVLALVFIYVESTGHHPLLSLSNWFLNWNTGLARAYHSYQAPP